MAKQKTAENYFKQAEKDYIDSNFNEAKINLNRAIEVDENYALAYNKLALILAEHFQSYNTSRQYFEKAIELNPKFAEAFNNLALLLTMRFQEYYQAKKFYEKAIKLNPKYERAYHNLAVLLAGYFRDFEKAKKYYEKTIELDPKYEGTYNNLALILSENFNEHEKAKDYYEKAIKLNPNYAEAYNNLAILYYRHFNDFVNAQKNLMLSIKIDPESDIPRQYLGAISNFEKDTFISEFKINNVRLLRDVRIPLSGIGRKHLFLTGKNGSGKTSVLKEAENYMQRILKIPVEEIFTEKGEKKFWQDTNDYKLKFNVKQHLLDLRLKYESGAYTIVFFGDERKLEKKLKSTKAIEKIDFQLKSLPKEDLSKNLLKFLIWQDYKQKSNINDEEIKRFFDKISSVLKQIYKDENLKFEINLKGLEFGDNLNFTIQLSNGNIFNLDEMAAGYSAIFEIVFELILRMEAKPEQENSEGIVLIDELETHLHVEMQKEIMPILIKIFPNIQFIVATHSPFVLNSISNVVIYDLEKQTIIEDGLKGVSYEGIVESYFGQEEYSIEIVKNIESYRELILKEKLSEKENERLIDLRIELKNSIKTPWLSPALASEFNELERIRKSK